MKSSLFSKNELATLAKVLEEGEHVIAVGRQHRLSKIIAPGITLATNKRLIVMKRDALGIRSDMHFIPYEHIVSFRLIHGFVFSSIKLRLLGASKPNEHAVTSEEEDETEINGLIKSTARILAKTLSINLYTKPTADNSAQIIHHSSPIINVFVMEKKQYENKQFPYIPNTFETESNPIVNDYNNQSAMDDLSNIINEDVEKIRASEKEKQIVAINEDVDEKLPVKQ